MLSPIPPKNSLSISLNIKQRCQQEAICYLAWFLIAEPPISSILLPLISPQARIATSCFSHLQKCFFFQGISPGRLRLKKKNSLSASLLRHVLHHLPWSPAGKYLQRWTPPPEGKPWKKEVGVLDVYLSEVWGRKGYFLPKKKKRRAEISGLDGQRNQLWCENMKNHNVDQRQRMRIFFFFTTFSKPTCEKHRHPRQ